MPVVEHVFSGHSWPRAELTREFFQRNSIARGCFDPDVVMAGNINFEIVRRGAAVFGQ